jgi:uncharacterized protein YabN with tetrapyrrole methylase and pyrophosphatase domain
MEEFKQILQTIDKLRQNCPSDIARTKENVIDCLKEELEEVKEALQKNDNQNLKEELGDLLFNVLFLIDIVKDEKEIQIEEILKTNYNKMVFRHPHVFAEPRKVSIEEADKIWQQQKTIEKAEGIKH